MMKSNKMWLVMCLCGLLGGLVGCTDMTGRGKAPLDRTIGPVTQEHPRVGHVYCMRGWLGIFSTGMDALADKIDKEVGAPAVSVANEEWRWLKEWIVEAKQKGELGNEPLVLLGHSYGADDQIRVAEYLKTKGIGVDLLVLLDPVTPPAVPTNVRRVYCIYMSQPLTDWYPAWRGVSATVVNANATQLTNIDLRKEDVGFDVTGINHPNIEKSEGVHNMIMEQIKMACPLRTAWLKNQRGTTAGARVPAKVDAR
jgi:pimeloyl-ACP methyl ester carboxylesterase